LLISVSSTNGRSGAAQFAYTVPDINKALSAEQDPSCINCRAIALPLGSMNLVRLLTCKVLGRLPAAIFTPISCGVGNDGVTRTIRNAQVRVHLLLCKVRTGLQTIPRILVCADTGDFGLHLVKEALNK